MRPGEELLPPDRADWSPISASLKTLLDPSNTDDREAFADFVTRMGGCIDVTRSPGEIRVICDADAWRSLDNMFRRPFRPIPSEKTIYFDTGRVVFVRAQ